MGADLRATPVDMKAPASSADQPVRVVLADDECLFRASLRQLLSVPPSVIREVFGVDVGAGFEVVGEAGSGHDTIRVVQAVNPDLLLLDLSMPCMNGLDAMRGLGPEHQNLRVIMLAGEIDRADLLQAVQLGVRGLLLKDAPTEVLFEATMSVLAGRYWVGPALVTDLLETIRPLLSSSDRAASQTPWNLTARERQVLAMVAAAHGNKEIARRFAVSEETIKHHLTKVFAKVGASTRLELAMLATQHGIVASDPEVDGSVAAAPAASEVVLDP
jgi:two-component system, NarL family, nitrate/nitrite response regulator NarL